MMTALLTGMNAVVTGSNRGMGKAVVERFACHGAPAWTPAMGQMYGLVRADRRMNLQRFVARWKRTLAYGSILCILI